MRRSDGHQCTMLYAEAFLLHAHDKSKRCQVKQPLSPRNTGVIYLFHALKCSHRKRTGRKYTIYPKEAAMYQPISHMTSCSNLYYTSPLVAMQRPPKASQALANAKNVHASAGTSQVAWMPHCPVMRVR
eukprot:1679120-Pleurochrysis_carterae.AAC.6